MLAGGLIAIVVYMFGAAVALLTTCGIPLDAPPCELGPAYMTLNLGFASAGAITAGWTAARLARRNPVAHAAILGVGLAAFALWGFSKPGSNWPAWYPWTLALVAVGGAWVGRLVESHPRQK